MPRIFISYRRADSAHATDRIHERLATHFGSESVFIDVVDIYKGVDYREHLNQVLSQCDMLLAVIGDRWLDSRFKNGVREGQRRLDDPDDSVRIEIQTAMARALPVIPVLLDDMTMPSAQQVPTEILDLVYRNATRIDAGREFANQVDQLISDVERLLHEAGYREIKVPGWWDVRCADDPTVEWLEVARLPAKVSIVPGKVYRLRASDNAIDADLASLVHPQALTALRELQLDSCKQITDDGMAYLSGLNGLPTVNLHDSCAGGGGTRIWPWSSLASLARWWPAWPSAPGKPSAPRGHSRPKPSPGAGPGSHSTR
jgi:TIR domain